MSEIYSYSVSSHFPSSSPLSNTRLTTRDNTTRLSFPSPLFPLVTWRARLSCSSTLPASVVSFIPFLIGNLTFTVDALYFVHRSDSSVQGSSSFAREVWGQGLGNHWFPLQPGKHSYVIVDWGGKMACDWYVWRCSLKLRSLGLTMRFFNSVNSTMEWLSLLPRRYVFVN